ncbi:MAG TPA: gamma-glutamyl-gamma-aminobutyrate hydrolase family protein [Gaiellaceae bacterium]|nr:gamma-glutamyl-gamma-aminobutyrate hydrolase family protein [Gaiellaceae bacterium]
MSAKPVIGITSYPAERVRYGVWEEPVIMIPASYVAAVEHAGGRSLVLPPSANSVEETLDLVHAIIFSGGGDIDPARYGAEAHPATDAPRRERDDAELALLTAALERDMPVLAVCRGSQVFNVALGGDLVQHLPDEVGHDRHRHTPGQFADHDVSVEPESRLGAILGHRAPVKSHHHQGFGRIGEGLVQVAWAEDGTVEGLEDPTKRFALGVLWHPEEGEDFALFRALVEQAREYRAAKPG